MNLETASANVGKTDESVEAVNVPEVLTEWSSGAPDDMYIDKIAHTCSNVDIIDASI